MKESILQTEKKCYLCGCVKPEDPLERHHVFGGSNRKLSEEDGLWIWLCGNEHHRNGKFAAHRNVNIAEDIHIKAEQAWCDHYGKTKEDFRKRYGKNYL